MRLNHPFHRFCDAVYSLCIWLAGIAIIIMSIIIPWGIFARYVLGAGSQWPEPVSILLMVMFTFFGAAAGVRANTHIGVEMVTDRLPPAGKKFAQLISSALMLLMSGFMLIWGTKLCAAMFQQTVPDLPWMPVGFTYLPVPLGALCTMLFVIEALFFGSAARRPVVNMEKSLESEPT
jgi:TRAP-type C4-dicarboxylate transport system permease small subunit